MVDTEDELKPVKMLENLVLEEADSVWELVIEAV